MAAPNLRQKLSGSTQSFLLILIGTASFFGATLIFTSPTVVIGEVLLDPVDLKDSDLLNRVPRSLLTLDNAETSYNNPYVLEGRQSKSGNDAYETLRQLSLETSQPYIRRKLFNTSVALTIPMFSFTLPQKAAEGSTVDLANQAIFGLFALLVSMLVFTVPVLFTGIRPFNIYGRSYNGDSAQDILDNLMESGKVKGSHMVNLMGADLRNRIGLNPDECLQKTVCDAHRYPKKYGMFALPFQIFFPPPPPDSKESGKSYSIYQMAAETGEYEKNEECWAKYNCFFDVMDLAMYLVDYFNPPAEDQDDI